MQRWGSFGRTALRRKQDSTRKAKRFASTEVRRTSAPLPNGSLQPQSPSQSQNPRRVHVFDVFLQSILYGGLFVLGAHAFCNYGYAWHSAYGVSMLPTMASDGDWVLISKRYRRGRDVHVGDVISFKHPVFIGQDAIKRVMGLQGDFVLMNTPEKSDAMIQIPEGHCWVVGDDLPHSRDSRMFGVLPMALIVGKIVWTFNWSTGFRRMGNGLQPADEDDVD